MQIIPQIDVKRYRKNIKNGICSNADPFQKILKFYEKSLKIDENSWIPPGSGKKGAPGPTFYRFGADLGSSWGPKMGPKSFKMGSKRVLKKQ